MNALSRLALFCCALPALSLAALRLGAALSISTDFESGSARVLELNAATRTIRIVPAGNGARGWPCWWFLRVDGLEPGKPITLEVTGSSAIVPAQGPKSARSLSPDWTLPARAAFSTNGTDWEQTAPGERRGRMAVYTVTAGGPTLWLAWGPPFTPKDAADFVNRAARAHGFAKAFTLARSREARPVPALKISEGEDAATRPAVWILARQHAWESGGTWVGIGFAEWLLSNDEQASWLRQHAEVWFVPVMDVDRVATGDGGKEGLPQDANFDWSEAPHWPEVAAAEKQILALASQRRMSLLVDLHNPGAGVKQVVLWITPTNLLESLAAQNQARLTAAIRSEVTTPLSVKAEPHWDGPGKDPFSQEAWHRLTCPWVYEHGNLNTVAITMETPWNTPASTTQGYRATGRGLGLAIERYLRESSP